MEDGGALKREGHVYRLNVRSVLWFIYLAVVVAFVVWWFTT
jgi:hypothetical protein